MDMCFGVVYKMCEAKICHCIAISFPTGEQLDEVKCFRISRNVQVPLMGHIPVTLPIQIITIEKFSIQ